MSSNETHIHYPSWISDCSECNALFQHRIVSVTPEQVTLLWSRDALAGFALVVFLVVLYFCI